MRPNMKSAMKGAQTFTFFYNTEYKIHEEEVLYSHIQTLADSNKLTLQQKQIGYYMRCKVIFDKEWSLKDFIDYLYGSESSSLIFMADVIENNGQPVRSREEIIRAYGLTPLRIQGIPQD